MATTALISQQKCILWRIPNFAEVRKSEEQLKEQLFKFEMSLGVTSGTTPPIRWRCYLVTKENSTVGLYIFPENLPPDLSASHARIRFQIKGNGRLFYFDGAFHVRMQGLVDKRVGYTNVIPRFSKDTPFLTADGALEIRITAIVYYPQAQNAELAAVEARYHDRFTSTFKSQLRNIRECGPNFRSTATKMVAMDGIEFPLNPLILAARSPVFRAMFQSNMSEGQKGVVEVKDVDSNSLEVLLHFLHRGELTANWKEEGIIEGLVYGAHKYMLQDLLEFLDQVLGLVCTDGNCGKLMGLAKTFELKEAQRRLLNYFQKNLSSDVDKVLKFAEDTANTATLMMMTQPEKSEAEEQERKKRKTAK